MPVGRSPAWLFGLCALPHRPKNIVTIPSGSERLDALARLAANVCDAPIALVSLIDEDRVWFKAAHGLGIKDGLHKPSFCCETANSKRLLEVVNASLDLRFSENLVVTGEPGVFYYAGAPIMFEGVGIGTVCVLDYAPRELPVQKLQALTEMASIATAMLRGRIEAFKFFSTTR
jgi:diguanylate cyclase